MKTCLHMDYRWAGKGVVTETSSISGNEKKKSPEQRIKYTYRERRKPDENFLSVRWRKSIYKPHSHSSQIMCDQPHDQDVTILSPTPPLITPLFSLPALHTPYSGRKRAIGSSLFSANIFGSITQSMLPRFQTTREIHSISKSTADMQISFLCPSRDVFSKRTVLYNYFGLGTLS